MRRIIFDTESDGFVEEATKIHIIVTQDWDTKEMFHFYDNDSLSKGDDNYKGTIKQGLRYIVDSDVAVCHNYIGHDLPLFLKLYPSFKGKLGVNSDQYCTESGKILDTLILSRIMDPDRAGHSVEDYGKQFGVPKPGHEDWSKLTEDMIHRCHEDVRIQSLIYGLYHDKVVSGKWDDAMELEHQLTEVCYEMCENKWKFDKAAGYELKDWIENRMADIEREIVPLLPYVTVNDKEFKTVFLKSGDFTRHVQRWIDDNEIPPNMWPCGPFSRIRFERVDLYSTTQVKEWLLEEGWEPDEWNYKKDKRGKFERDENNNLIKASPKVTESSLDQLANKTGKDSIKLLLEFFQCKHRLSLLWGKNKPNGFLQKLDKDNYYKGGIITCGTNTARCKHIGIVNIPKVGSYLGSEMRALFTSRPGHILVGWDASALENNMEAHYTFKFDNGAYAEELLGGDSHTKNAEVFGVDRNTAKGGKYALTYGCSPDKLASTLGKSKKLAKVLYEAFWRENEALRALKESVEAVFEKRKQQGGKTFVKAIDKRELYVRYKHALINTLFQSAGSIVVKRAYLMLAKEVKRRGLDVKFVGFFHDEVQADVRPDQAEEYGKLSIDCLTKAGEYYKLRVRLTGEYKIGNNWKDTH